MLSYTIVSQLIAFLALTSSTFATPIVSNDDLITDYKVWAAENEVITACDENFEKRAGGLYACNAPNFSNAEGCILLKPSIGQCTNFPDAFTDTISSIGPDSNLICSLFDNNFCQGNQPVINNVVSPGFNNLHNVARPGGGNWADRLASYQCFRN